MNNVVQRQFIFSLHLTHDQFLDYYKGSAKGLLVIAECGRRISFPPLRLIPFVTENGVSGRFLLNVDSNNRFVSLQRIQPRR
jgi:hypothetical protein